jgi:hypothetical protein
LSIWRSEKASTIFYLQNGRRRGFKNTGLAAIAGRRDRDVIFALRFPDPGFKCELRLRFFPKIGNHAGLLSTPNGPS